MLMEFQSVCQADLQADQNLSQCAKEASSEQKPSVQLRSQGIVVDQVGDFPQTSMSITIFHKGN